MPAHWDYGTRCVQMTTIQFAVVFLDPMVTFQSGASGSVTSEFLVEPGQSITRCLAWILLAFHIGLRLFVDLRSKRTATSARIILPTSCDLCILRLRQ